MAKTNVGERWAKEDREKLIVQIEKHPMSAGNALDGAYILGMEAGKEAQLDEVEKKLKGMELMFYANAEIQPFSDEERVFIKGYNKALADYRVFLQSKRVAK